MRLKVLLLRTLVPIIATLAFCCVGYIAYILWPTDIDNLGGPSDAMLFKAFHDNRADFERLRQMMGEDRPSENLLNMALLGKVSDAARRNEYKTALSKIGLNVTVASTNRSIRFIYSIQGGSAIGPSAFKGIEYLEVDPQREGKLENNLDHPGNLATGDVYLRPIESNWYIIVQKID
jgi:hypothetical protein